jgi:hypothetical protein
LSHLAKLTALLSTVSENIQDWQTVVFSMADDECGPNYTGQDSVTSYYSI